MGAPNHRQNDRVSRNVNSRSWDARSQKERVWLRREASALKKTRHYSASRSGRGFGSRFGFGFGFRNGFVDRFMGAALAWFAGGFLDGLVVNNADGLIEDVMRKKADCFPNSFVNGGGASSFLRFFPEELEQMISETRVSSRDLQRQVCNALKRMIVRTGRPLDGLVHHGFLVRHFKKAAVFSFFVPLSSAHLDQVLHRAARFLRVAFTLLRGQIVLLLFSCCGLPLPMILEPGLPHFPLPQDLGAPVFEMAPTRSRPNAI